MEEKDADKIAAKARNSAIRASRCADEKDFNADIDRIRRQTARQSNSADEQLDIGHIGGDRKAVK